MKTVWEKILAEPRLGLPDESQCPGCGWFDTRHPGVQEIMAKAGRPLYQARGYKEKPCKLGDKCKAQ